MFRIIAISAVAMVETVIDRFKNILTVDSNVRIFAFDLQVYVSESNGAHLCLMSRNKFGQFTKKVNDRPRSGKTLPRRPVFTS